MRLTFLIFAVLLVCVSIFGQTDDVFIRDLQPKYHNPFLPRPPVDTGHSFTPMAPMTPYPEYLGFPTYIAGDTYYDLQHNSTMGRMIAVDHEGGVHVAWMDALDPFLTNRVVKYNYFHRDSIGSPTYPTGWICGGDGARVDNRDYAGYCNISVNDEHTVPTVVYHDHASGGENKTNAAFDGMYYTSFGTARCGFTTPAIGPEPYIIPGTTLDAVAIWPKIAQIDTTVFVVSTSSATEGIYNRNRLIYYRGFIDPEWGAYSEMAFEPPVEIEDDQIGITVDITAYKDISGNEIAMGYIRHDTVVANDTCYCTEEDYYTHILDAAAIMVRKSTDMGETWSEPDTITEPGVHTYSSYPESLYLGTYIDTLTGDTIDIIRPIYSRPIDLNMAYDSDGYLHIVWGALILSPYEGWENICEGTCSTGVYCQEVVYHWSEETGVIDKVVFDPIWRPIGCPAYVAISRMSFTNEPQIAIDNDDNIFVFWEQYGAEYWWGGPSDDIAGDGFENAEIYCAIFIPDSARWSDPLNVTNTYCPGCCVNCHSEIEVTLAERIDDYIHLFFEVDRVPGYGLFDTLWPLSNNNMVYLPIPKDSLLCLAYSTGVPESEGGISTPKAFRLGRNWPNPFNAATAFWFDVHTPGHYTIDVIDMTGRTVSKIAEHDLNTGRHIYFWEGYSDNGWFVPSGVYFLRARDDKGNSVSRKITLIK